MSLLGHGGSSGAPSVPSLLGLLRWDLVRDHYRAGCKLHLGQHIEHQETNRLNNCNLKKKKKVKCFVVQPHSLLNHCCDQTPVRSSAPPQLLSPLLSDGMGERRIGRAKVKNKTSWAEIKTE